MLHGRKVLCAQVTKSHKRIFVNTISSCWQLQILGSGCLTTESVHISLAPRLKKALFFEIILRGFRKFWCSFWVCRFIQDLQLNQGLFPLGAKLCRAFTRVLKKEKIILRTALYFLHVGADMVKKSPWAQQPIPRTSSWLRKLVVFSQEFCERNKKVSFARKNSKSVFFLSEMTEFDIK